MSAKVAQIIVDELIAKIEKNPQNWVRGWAVGDCCNAITKRPYSGLNALLLELGNRGRTFMTKKQVFQNNGDLRGVKPELITFFRNVEKKDSSGEVTDAFPMMRFYKLYPVKEVAHLPQKFYDWEIEKQESDFQVNNDMESIVSENNITINHGGKRAFYSPTSDEIGMPPKESFVSTEEYYQTLAHEMIHWTGHKNRNNRLKPARFGNISYSWEELVAETGACILCSKLGIEVNMDNSAAYLNGWRKNLKENPQAILSVLREVNKAVDFLLSPVEEVAHA